MHDLEAVACARSTCTHGDRAKSGREAPGALLSAGAERDGVQV
jgi:hypothetical protein